MAAFAAVWIAACVGTASYGSLYASQQIGLIIVYGLLALSFTFTWGLGGVFSLCQPALFGIGAYTYGAATINLMWMPGAGLVGLVGALLVAAAAAAVFGWFLFYGRLSGMYVAIATLAFDLILLTFMNGTAGPQYHIGLAELGGQNGMVGIAPLSFRAPENSEGFSFSEFLLFVGALNLLVTLGLWRATRMPWFRVVLCIKENELRARTLGFDSRAYRLLLFTVAAAAAGLAGGEYAAQQLYISTNIFSLSMAALVIIWVLLGGKSSVPGAYIGTAIMQLLTLFLASVGTDIEVFISGLVMIGVVMFLPDGIASVGNIVGGRMRIKRGTAAGRRTAGPAATPGTTPQDTGGLLDFLASSRRKVDPLTIENASKSFGGTHAVRDLTLAFQACTLTSIVGPNGAGKSTLFHLISGRYRQDEGTIHYGSASLSASPLERRSALGIAVKYQSPQLFPELSVHEHLCLASHGVGTNWRQAQADARRLARYFRLADKSEAIAQELAHGDAQRLDIAMALASRPSLLLLDEPTAGLNAEEITRLEHIVTQLKGRISIIVITHDFGFVSRLDAPVVVMSEGKIFKTGTVRELKDDAAFIRLYLGRNISTAAA